MKVYESNSGQDIIYLDHSSSGAAGALTQSSADPISLMNRVRNSLFFNTSDPLALPLDLTPDEVKLYLYNMQHYGEEPEDIILANSDILLRLLEQAKQEPPSNDWERELDEL